MAVRQIEGVGEVRNEEQEEIPSLLQCSFILGASQLLSHKCEGPLCILNPLSVEPHRPPRIRGLNAYNLVLNKGCYDSEVPRKGNGVPDVRWSGEITLSSLFLEVREMDGVPEYKALFQSMLDSY